MKGVRSLIKYAAMSDYMLVPTEEEELRNYPAGIPGYGSRGWCRVEYFIFSLAAEMRGREMQHKKNMLGKPMHVPGTAPPLYRIRRDGSREQSPVVQVTEENIPSQGALSNPADKALVQDLEDTMIEAYGKVIVEIKCKAGAGGVADLRYKMIRACHVEALFEAVNKYEVKELNLGANRLGDAGAEAIARMLRTNCSLTVLNLMFNKIGAAGKKAVREAVEGREGLELKL